MQQQMDYTVGEIQQVYGLDPAEVLAAIESGALVAKRWGRAVRVNVWQLADWWSRRKAGRMKIKPFKKWVTP